MLCALQIKNLALVEDLRVEFQPGLNIITGETGAGKSLLIGALSLLLGERADKSVIRTGQSQASAECVLALPAVDPVNSLLAEAGIDQCQDGQLILRRVVSVSGGGCFVNGCPATVQTLRKIGNLLVDMHGPHDHQSLLSQDFQMDLLDAFGGLAGMRASYQTEFVRLCALQAELKSLDCDDRTVAEQIDLLSHQVKEIDEAAPVEGEEEDTKARHVLMTNAQRILEGAQNICQILTDGESSVIDSLASVHRELEHLRTSLPESAQWAEEANNAAVQLRELSKTISSRAHDIDSDPRQLETVEARLAVYQKLRRKYGATVAEILETLEAARKRLHDLQTRGERIADLNSRIAAATAAVRRLGGKLGRERRSAAVNLASAITHELQDLGFTKGAFHVELADAEPAATGTDTIEFGFAPNVGEAMRPLRMIASSGEISRVMLATKAVLAKHDRIPVLVFDEVDTNVGGEMGFAIGQKLAGIARTHQVICITHLPQVAVHGLSHFAVAKQVRGDRTFTEIRTLDGEARTDEIARMLGGSAPSKLTRDHAREMLGVGISGRKKL
ncbi:MAG: DNA repair protein RecN [bacterium]